MSETITQGGESPREATTRTDGQNALKCVTVCAIEQNIAGHWETTQEYEVEHEGVTMTIPTGVWGRDKTSAIERLTRWVKDSLPRTATVRVMGRDGEHVDACKLVMNEFQNWATTRPTSVQLDGTTVPIPERIWGSYLEEAAVAVKQYVSSHKGPPETSDPRTSTLAPDDEDASVESALKWLEDAIGYGEEALKKEQPRVDDFTKLETTLRAMKYVMRGGG